MIYVVYIKACDSFLTQYEPLVAPPPHLHKRNWNWYGTFIIRIFIFTFIWTRSSSLWHRTCVGTGHEMQCLHRAGSQPRAISCSNILQLTQLCVLVGRKSSHLSCPTGPFFPLFIFNDCALTQRECRFVSSSSTGQISLGRMKIAADVKSPIQTFICKDRERVSADCTQSF